MKVTAESASGGIAFELVSEDDYEGLLLREFEKQITSHGLDRVGGRSGGARPGVTGIVIGPARPVVPAGPAQAEHAVEDSSKPPGRLGIRRTAATPEGYTLADLRCCGTCKDCVLDPDRRQRCLRLRLDVHTFSECPFVSMFGDCPHWQRQES